MELLTSREAAARLNITLKVLHGLRAQGRIRYIAITERKILYRPEDCDVWLAAGSPRGTRQAPSNGIVPFSQRPRSGIVVADYARRRSARPT